MTFYWWSHWFWITTLGTLFATITTVQAYPSQEIFLEYNQSIEVIKPVTKLYQTTVASTWPTATPSSQNTISDVQAKSGEESLIAENRTKQEILKVVDEAVDDVDVDQSPVEGLEFKRSADGFNKTTHEAHPKPITTLLSDSEPGAAEKDADDRNAKGSAEPAAKPEGGSNYTNFSSTEIKDRKNSTTINITASNSDTATTLKPIGSLIPSTFIDNQGPSREQLSAVAQPPPAHFTTSSATSEEHKVPFTLENVNKEDELRRAESEHRTRKSKVLNGEYRQVNRFINFSTDSKNLLTRSASTAPNDFDSDEGNISSEALAIQRTYFLDAGAISAICFTIFGVCCTVGTIGIVLYRRRYLNKPQALSEPDSSVYIDDSTMRDNSDEMYSLDNDSFLNSLEAMTIQNYWTDTVKHTKL